MNNNILNEYKAFCDKYNEDQIKFLYQKYNDFFAGDHSKSMLVFLFEKMIELNEATKEIQKWKKTNLKEISKQQNNNPDRFKKLEME